MTKKIIQLPVWDHHSANNQRLQALLLLKETFILSFKATVNCSVCSSCSFFYSLKIVLPLKQVHHAKKKCDKP